MSMRDQIADICSTGARWRDKGEYVIADAILAALPDMIAPLVWGQISDAFQVAGRDYKITYYEGMKDPYKLEHSAETSYYKMEDAAKDAANTHHRAAIMAAFTGETP